MSSRTAENSKPFLRWAGGKTWLLKHLTEYLPKTGYNRYHEPFLGGGSVFFHLNPIRAYLSDLNPELINTYVQVKENVESVIQVLESYQNTETFYYHLRGNIMGNDVEKAARFIFLNQTSFNGIYRVNLNGEYNVPFGFRTKIFLDRNNLRSASKALEMVRLTNGDFRQTVNVVGENDLVFLDPPYTVTHNNNGFIKYNKKLFDLESQQALSKYIDEIKNRGAYYILTNAAHEVVKNIFRKDNDHIVELSRASLIGGKSAVRGQYGELLITNVNI